MKLFPVLLALIPCTALPSTASPPARPCITVIDDLSDPKALREHGIEPCDPETLQHVYDVLASRNAACTLSYLVVRADAARAIPVTAEIEPFLAIPPTVPERAGVKLPDLQKAYRAYREEKDKYDLQLAAHEERRQEARERFVRAALDAAALAEAERDAQRAGRRPAPCSDIDGTIQLAVATLRAMASDHAVLILNSDLDDNVAYRRNRSSPLSEQELPPSIVKAIYCTNASFKPDGSNLLKSTPVARYHAPSVRAAADQVASSLGTTR